MLFRSLSFDGNSFKFGWEFNLESNQWKKVFSIIPDLILDKARNSDQSLEYKSIIAKKFKLINDSISSSSVLGLLIGLGFSLSS